MKSLQQRQPIHFRLPHGFTGTTIERSRSDPETATHSPAELAGSAHRYASHSLNTRHLAPKIIFPLQLLRKQPHPADHLLLPRQRHHHLGRRHLDKVCKFPAKIAIRTAGSSIGNQLRQRLSPHQKIPQSPPRRRIHRLPPRLDPPPRKHLRLQTRVHPQCPHALVRTPHRQQRRQKAPTQHIPFHPPCCVLISSPLTANGFASASGTNVTVTASLNPASTIAFIRTRPAFSTAGSGRTACVT